MAATALELNRPDTCLLRPGNTNCGGCGMACAAGEACLNGACTPDVPCASDADCAADGDANTD